MEENKNNERLSAKEQYVVALTDSDKDFFDEDKEKNEEQLSALECQIVELVGKGKTLKFSEPTVINVDEFVAKDVIDSVSVKDDGTIELQGSRIDGAGVRAGFALEGRDEYELSDLDKALDAVKWHVSECRREALNAVGYPYDFKPREDGSMDIPTIGESLYWEYAAGLISLKDAAEEFYHAGWTNYVDEKYTLAKFSQLNSQFGKLDADLRPLAVSVKEDGTIELQGRRIDHASLDDVLLRAKELDMTYHPVGLSGGIHVSGFGNGSGNADIDLSYATVENGDVAVYESLYDVFDYDKARYLSELPDDAQKNVLDRLAENFSAEDKPMVIVFDRMNVPSYAISALINGDFSGIENREDKQAVYDFMKIKASYSKSGFIYDVQPDSEGFSRFPAFGQPTVCDTVFVVRPVTPKEMRKMYEHRLEYKALSSIRDRIIHSWQRAFTAEQVDALRRYHQTVAPGTPAKEVFSRLLHEVSQYKDIAGVPNKWVSDTAKELNGLAEGKVRFESLQLKR